MKVNVSFCGSIACAQQVRSGKVVDILALADPGIFDEMLIPEYL